MRLSPSSAALLGAVLAFLGTTAAAQTKDGVDDRKVAIWSEGSRLSADVFWPKGAVGQKLPTIIMGYGWGGTAERLRPDALVFAAAGYLVVTFDYRGWGESESRVVLAGPAPADRPNNRFIAAVQEVREVMDPLSEALDWSNVIHWVQAEPMSDTSRIGLWGNSLGGALAVYVAGYDHRVKAVHSQVSPLGGGAADVNRIVAATGYDDATKRARGEIGYPKPGEVVIGNLRGAPIRDHFVFFSPAQAMMLAPDCAMQFVLAENEELFDNKRAAIEPYEKFTGTKKNLVILPGITHFGVYGPARAQAQKLALDWFDKYLKP
jgi:dienelactone hydrolase